MSANKGTFLFDELTFESEPNSTGVVFRASTTAIDRLILVEALQDQGSEAASRTGYIEFSMDFRGCTVGEMFYQSR